MLELLNKKRKNITLLSLILTLLIIVTSVIIISFTIDHIIIMFFVLFSLVVLLYLLSSKIIIPKYQTLRAEVVENIFKSKFNDIIVKKNNTFNPSLEIFFSKPLINYLDSNILILNNIEYFVEFFNVVDKVNSKKNSNIVFKGYFVQFEYKLPFTKDILAIAAEHTDSKNFQKTIDNHFTGSTFKTQFTRNGKYFTNTSKKEDFDLLFKILKNLTDFHIFFYKDNKISILIKEKNNNFTFDLKNEIDNNTLQQCKECYENIIKLVSNMEV